MEAGKNAFWRNDFSDMFFAITGIRADPIKKKLNTIWMWDSIIFQGGKKCQDLRALDRVERSLISILNRLIEKALES